MEERISLLLVEDHTIVRQGLRRLLEDMGMEVVGEAGNGRKALVMARQLKPQIVIMDISLPRLNGIEATRKIKKEMPYTKVIILTIHSAESYVYKAFEAGASGYLLKETASEDLLVAIKTVIRGDNYLSPEISPDVLKKYLKLVRSGRKVDEFSRLTNREREVLQLIAEGYTSQVISKMLYVARKTIENHRANIMKKLDLHDTASLVKYAIKIGLVEL